MTAWLFFILGVGKSLNNYERYDAMNLFPSDSAITIHTKKHQIFCLGVKQQDVTIDDFCVSFFFYMERLNPEIVVEK